MAFFYKYRSLTSDEDFARAQSFIRDGWVWFSTADKVNDPFEFRCTFNWASDRQSVAKMLAIADACGATSGALFDAALQRTKEVVTKISATALRDLEMKFSLVLWRRMAETVSLFCMSDVADDMLMWSHYADRYSGICVELNHASLDIWARAVQYSDTLTPVAAEQVTRHVVEPNQLLKTLDEAAITLEPDSLPDKMFFRKAICWQNEREYRLVSPLIGSSLRQLPVGSVTRVIMGFAMSGTQKRRLAQWMRSAVPNVKIAYALPRSYDRHGVVILNEDQLPV